MGPSWGLLGPSWGLLEAFLGPSWAILGLFWAILGNFGAILGPSWAILGHLGDILGPLGGQLGSFRAFVDHLGAILGYVCNILPVMLTCVSTRSCDTFVIPIPTCLVGVNRLENALGIMKLSLKSASGLRFELMLLSMMVMLLMMHMIAIVWALCYDRVAYDEQLVR